MITATNPSTGQTVTYTGTRKVVCATFVKGSRSFTTKTNSRGTGHVKVWTVVDEGTEWVHIGWSAQSPLKAQGAARATNPYFAHYMAVEVTVTEG